MPYITNMVIPSGWQADGNIKIEKDFKFKNFPEALDFVNKVGEIAESVNHHPDIFLHDWRYVKITVTTHSAGQLTQKDIDVAPKIDNLLK